MISIIIPATSAQGMANTIKDMAKLSNAELVNLITDNLNHTVSTYTDEEQHAIYDQLTGKN
ncbi:MAG: hypothetical protein JKX76_04965 [Colwellia sp.]|nr:hypothetical protein [Colwellia sp.]